MQRSTAEKIEEAKFKTFGCGSAIASSALAVEWVKGKTLDEARTIKNSDIANHLSLPPVKIHCSVLAEGAIKAAIEDYKAKQSGKSIEDINFHKPITIGDIMVMEAKIALI